MEELDVDLLYETEKKYWDELAEEYRALGSSHPSGWALCYLHYCRPKEGTVEHE